MPISSDCIQPRLSLMIFAAMTALSPILWLSFILPSMSTRLASMCRWRMPLLESRCRAAMYCEPLRLVCFEEARLVLPERSMESNTRMNSFDKLAQSFIVHPRLSSSDGEISILITFLPSGLPLLIFSANFLCTSIIRPYIASGEILSGKRLALTISAFSLLTEYLMAFAPCDMVEAFAIIIGEGIYSVR